MANATEKERTPPANALIVVDVQVDFCPGGSLPVGNGDKIAARIHDYVKDHTDDYKVIVATKDWHPADDPTFSHFAAEPDYVNTWPIHCLQYHAGSEFHPNLNATGPNGFVWPPVDEMVEFDVIFYKGQFSAAYSGFEGTTYPPGGAAPLGWTLDAYLENKGVGHVDVVGLALDYCVAATALDAVTLGYDTTVLLDMTAAVRQDAMSIGSTCSRLKDAGVHLDGS